tara:strand:- start:2511 stop:2915 length:405 start_codon:yes stop_codon:yes gene_type:complete
MIAEIKNIKSTKKDLRNFGVLFSIIFFSLDFFYFKSEEILSFLLLAGTFLLLSAIIFPLLLKPLYYPWMLIATILGWFMSRLILFLIFFMVFTPIGLLGRLLKKEFINLKLDKDSHSYWNLRGDQIDNDYKNQY